MCQPKYYRVAWEINPWMQIRAQPDRKLAMKQWWDLVTLYNQLGVDIELIEPEPELPDMVFTANAGWCRWGRVVLANFRTAERMPERLFIQRWLERDGRELGYEMVSLPDGVAFEGQGDVVTVGDHILMGYGFRTNRRAAKHLEEIYGFETGRVKPVRLVDPWFYHLDTCSLFIPAINLLLWYPPAFDQNARSVILALPCDKFAVDEEDARRFVCNGVFAGPEGRDIIMEQPSSGLRRALEEYGRARGGITIHPRNTSEFRKAGGSNRCLTFFLPEKPTNNPL